MTYKEIISNYIDIPGGIIEAFLAIQEEYGYLPEEAISDAARAFKISAAEACGVATFYKTFTIKPRDKGKFSNKEGGSLMDYKKIIANYTAIPGGIIEAFHAIQEEYGYLPETAISEAARAFKISVAEAYGVATFYSMFSIKPRGKNVIRVCESAPCHVAGATEVVAALEKELGINMGETTPDGLFTLEFTECIGQCQDNPVISINGKPYQGVNPAKIPAIIASIKKDQDGNGSEISQIQEEEDIKWPRKFA